jgi:sugar lactone lactonase YvrE
MMSNRMLRVTGSKHRFMWGWFGASSLVLFLIISGCVISPRRLPGDIVPGTTPTPTPTGSPTPTPTPGATPAQGKLYVSNAGNDSIVRFDAALTDSGNVPAATTISGTNTQLAAPESIFLDTAADRLYVANNADFSILVFDNISTKTLNAAPDRVIGATGGSLISPSDVSLDKTRDLLYVADDTQIEVFASASTASGTPAPTRTYTPGFSVSAVLIDSANDRLYAADQTGNAINVYDNASGLAAGTIAASRTISGANTHLGAPDSIQIDGAGRLVVSNGSAKSITIYNGAATASANAAPVAEIVGTNTGFNAPAQIVVDPTGTGTLYIADAGAGKIYIYANLSSASTTGNIAPTRTISGPATNLTGNSPIGIALDRTR